MAYLKSKRFLLSLGLLLVAMVFSACNNSDRPVAPGSSPSFAPVACAGFFAFGDKNIESTSSINSGSVQANQYTYTGGDIVNLALYTSGTGQFRMALYADNGSGAPSTLIAQSAAVSTMTSPGWNTAPISAHLPSGTYWLAFQTDSNVTTYYNSNSTSLPYINQAFGAFPGNYSGYTACSCSVISMIANYCP